MYKTTLKDLINIILNLKLHVSAICGLYSEFLQCIFIPPECTVHNFTGGIFAAAHALMQPPLSLFNIFYSMKAPSLYLQITAKKFFPHESIKSMTGINYGKGESHLWRAAQTIFVCLSTSASCTNCNYTRLNFK